MQAIIVDSTSHILTLRLEPTHYGFLGTAPLNHKGKKYQVAVHLVEEDLKPHSGKIIKGQTEF